MAQKKIDKRKFIEGVMNLNIFGEMLLKIRKDYNEKKKDCDTQVALFSNEQKNLDNLKAQQENQKLQNIEKTKQFLERIKEHNKEIDGLKNSNISVVDQIKTLKQELEDKENKIEQVENKDLNELNFKLKEIQFEIQNKKQKVEEFKQEYSDIKNKEYCPTCKRAYSVDNCDIKPRLDELNKNIEDLKGNIENSCTKEQDIQEKINKIKKIIIVYKQKNQTLRKDIENLINLDNQIKIIETKNIEIEKNIEELKKQKDNFKPLIEKIELNIDTYQEKIKDLYKELDVIENAKLVVSEDGVKTVIIKKILKFLNDRLNYYMSTMEAPCVCYFDETFDTSIKNLNGKEIDYWNLSGGERKRVDSSIIFTFQDLLKVQTGTNFNLSMYDEWADSALDEKGMTKFLEILRQKVEKSEECIYLISHNPNIFKNDIDNVVFIEKKNGNTVLKNDN
jgi:chromosome segregation ATPase